MVYREPYWNDFLYVHCKVGKLFVRRVKIAFVTTSTDGENRLDLAKSCTSFSTAFVTCCWPHFSSGVGGGTTDFIKQLQ